MHMLAPNREGKPEVDLCAMSRSPRTSPRNAHRAAHMNSHHLDQWTGEGGKMYTAHF